MRLRAWMIWTVVGATTGCASATDEAETSSVSMQAMQASGPRTSAGVRLVAHGTLSAALPDRAPRTAGPLESGAAGNLLGGLGSALAYTGGDTFLALPDRGPNATVYNPLVDNTTSYVTRFHTLTLRLSAAPAGAALPLMLTPTLARTTLLYASEPLFYGSGADLSVTAGTPRLNDPQHAYFTGRADNFDPTAPVLRRAHDGRLDPEGLRSSRDGTRLYVSDEYGPYVYEFDRDSGRRLRVFALPDGLAVSAPRVTELDEVATNQRGRVTNKGIEGLAITPEGDALVGALQSALIQDGGARGRYTRLVRIDLHTGAVTQYAYPLSDVGTPELPKYAAISEIVAINDHAFLIDERDSAGLGAGSDAAFKRLYRVDLRDAREVSGLTGEAALAGAAVTKTLFLDLVEALGAHGIARSEVPAKIEGLAFGQDVTLDGARMHTLFVSSDNDFLPRLVDAVHPRGVDNPNQWFVFAFDEHALPGYVPQVRTGEDCE